MYSVLGPQSPKQVHKQVHIRPQVAVHTEEGTAYLNYYAMEMIKLVGKGAGEEDVVEVAGEEVA